MKIILLGNERKERTFSQWDLKKPAEKFSNIEQVEIKRETLSNYRKPRATVLW